MGRLGLGSGSDGSEPEENAWGFMSMKGGNLTIDRDEGAMGEKNTTTRAAAAIKIPTEGLEPSTPGFLQQSIVEVPTAADV